MRALIARFVSVAAALAVLLGVVATVNSSQPVTEVKSADIHLASYDPRAQPDLRAVVSDWLRKATEGRAARCSEGSARQWNSAGKSVVRKCLWGGELLLSKNDSKIAAAVTGGAISFLVGPFLVANTVRGLFGTSGGSGSAVAVSNAIDNGHCVKLLLEYWWLPHPGLYHCT